jgi:hypothetical protein
MAIDKTAVQNGVNPVRYALIGVLLVAAFFGAYKFASASSSRANQARASAGKVAAAGTQLAAGSSAAGSADPSASGGCGGACCGGGSSQPTADGVTGTKVEGTAEVAGNVQKISVDVTSTYAPNVIRLKAGVPAEITFSQAQGCTGQVQSQTLKFLEDLSTGPQVVVIKNPQPGTYDFECGMNMVFGKIVVE